MGGRAGEQLVGDVEAAGSADTDDGHAAFAGGSDDGRDGVGFEQGVLVGNFFNHGWTRIHTDAGGTGEITGCGLGS